MHKVTSVVLRHPSQNLSRWPFESLCKINIQIVIRSYNERSKHCGEVFHSQHKCSWSMTCGFYLIILFTTTLMHDNLFFLFIMALALYFFTVHNVTLPEMCLLANHSSYSVGDDLHYFSLCIHVYLPGGILNLHNHVVNGHI